MKHIFSFSTLTLCFITCFAQQIQVITQSEVLSIAKEYFSGKDCDYYLVNDSAQYWNLFVDAEPLKGWEHECYTFTYPQAIPVGLSAYPYLEKRTLPPDDDLTPLEVNSQINYISSDIEIVEQSNSTTIDEAIANRTYALIISGGVNKNSNYERYWNDCSFIYQTLIKKYAIPKRNISVIMSDGTDPGEDMRTTNWSYKSSPLDLDFDGSPDIQYSATRTNIYNIISNLGGILKKDDHLFIFVIDHGGSNDMDSQSYINLWGNEKLQDYELAQWLAPITKNLANVDIVLGQCYSGGFIDDLTAVGCVVSTASTGSESSWSCKDRPYDEFVYQWTSAINGNDSYGIKTDADVDKNGIISIEEAFKYAELNDRANETPMYNSTPISVGEDLAFNKIAPSIDLYIKDNNEDTGKEPNLTTEYYWKSPSIWVRNKADNIEIPENPYYSEDHMSATIYVKVYNRGKETYTGGKWLHVYWAKGSTKIKDSTWKGYDVINDVIIGGLVKITNIKNTIAPGDSTIIPITWALPADILNPDYSWWQRGQYFSIMAKITDSHIEEGYEEGKEYFDVLGSNDVAQKSIVIVKGETAEIMIANPYPLDEVFAVECVSEDGELERLLNCANITINLSRDISEMWEAGGLQALNFDINQNSDSCYDLTIESANEEAKIEGIYMPSNQYGALGVTVDYKYPLDASLSSSYTFDIIQKDSSEKIIGGYTVVVNTPTVSISPIDITQEPIDNIYSRLDSSVDESSDLYWTDALGNTIGTTSSVIVAPTSNNNTYSVTATSADGEIANQSITLEPTIGIKALSSGGDFLDIDFYSNIEPTNSLITISSLTTGDVLISTSGEGTTLRIDTSTLPSDVYVLTYTYQNQIVDTYKFNKK
jgi:hypothetical protein